MNPVHPRLLQRRHFLGLAGSTVLAALASCRSTSKSAGSGEFLFVEAEGFDDRGGWELDQQSMDQMGSAYLLAHGLGVPVRDAVTQLKFPTAGAYRVWVRTKDWVAPWKAQGAPGKFQVILNKTPLAETFGTKGAEWHWQDGGVVEVTETVMLALHDLTGFEGRCEAILFCKDTEFVPSNDAAALTIFRRELLGLSAEPLEGGSFDLVVVGGGLAGAAAAISAARQGLTVALVQDRPVLGGNGSSEVRVWPEGHTCKPPFPHVGEIVEELLPTPRTDKKMNGAGALAFDDEAKLKVVREEERITLKINFRAMEVDAADAVIRSVVIQNIIDGRRERLFAKFFADCTGDAKVGYLAGADYEYSLAEPLMGSSNLFSVLDASQEDQILKCECKDKTALTMAYQEGQHVQPFPRCPWALDLSEKPFPGRAKFSGDAKDDLSLFERQWYWESGFQMDQVNAIELIRDHNFRAMYGAWDALKNVDGLYPNHRLGWAAFIAGKRESRRLMGDVVLDGKDFTDARIFDDAVFPCSWHIDLHFPEKSYQEGFEGEEFVSDYTRSEEYKYKGIYWAPYRCLYSRNIRNLFMAGRDISVSKTGLGPVRVMKTCGMMGEIVGKAAAVCVKHQTTPRGIYESHLSDLKSLMAQAGSTRVSSLF